MSHQGSFYYVLLSTEDDLGKTLVGLIHVALCVRNSEKPERTVRAMLVTAWEEAYNLPHTPLSISHTGGPLCRPTSAS